MLHLNGQPLSVTHFPDNTSQVWKLPEEIIFKSHPAQVLWKFGGEGEFLHLAQLKQLLDLLTIPATLEITFLPYARQDKEVSNNSTFALIPFANLLASLEFEKVFIRDPHSKVALDLIPRSEAIYPVQQLVKAISEVNPDILCYPDKGAVSKYSELPVYKSYRYIYGEKVRDQLTGNIISYKVVGDPAGKNVLIVDDICDGGMTFKILAKDLLAAGANKVSLFVTHGIFSKGIRTLFDSGIERIFTQDGEMSVRSF